MKFFNFNITRNKPQSESSIHSIQFAHPELPVIKEIRGKDYVYFGEDNLYPQKLKKMLMTSPTQGAINKTKAGMLSGNGFLINNTMDKDTSNSELEKYNPVIQNEFKKFLMNPNDDNDLEEIHSLMSKDFMEIGSAAMEVVWSLDFTKIATIKYVKSSNIRSGKYVNGKVQDYFYSRDWFYYTKEGYIPERIAAFDVNNKQDYNQLIYIKSGNLDYYGEPSYIEAISNIEVEAKISNFDLSNITNAFAPSIQVKFYEKPQDPEKKRAIVEGIKKQYQGTGNTGRAMVFFSEGKELSPDVLPVPVSDLDKQYVSIDQRTTQKILTANQVSSPLLFGIATTGQLGGSTELATAYQIFNKSVIQPDRRKFEKVYNKLLAINKIPIKINIMPFNPLIDDTISKNIGNSTAASLNTLSPLVATKVLEVMTVNEVRDIISLPPELAIPAGQTNSNVI